MSLGYDSNSSTLQMDLLHSPVCMELILKRWNLLVGKLLRSVPAEHPSTNTNPWIHFEVTARQHTPWIFLRCLEQVHKKAIHEMLTTLWRLKQKFSIAPQKLPSQKETRLPTIMVQGLCHTSGMYMKGKVTSI